MCIRDSRNTYNDDCLLICIIKKTVYKFDAVINRFLTKQFIQKTLIYNQLDKILKEY